MMPDKSWRRVVQDAEDLAVERANAATEPEFRWSAPPGLLVEAGECAEWLVHDGRARWVGDSVLLEPPKVPGHEPRTAAAEAYVRTISSQLSAHGVSVRLVGLAEPEHRSPGQSWDDVVLNGMRAFRPPANGWFGPPVEDETDSPPQRAVVEAFQARPQ